MSALLGCGASWPWVRTSRLAVLDLRPSELDWKYTPGSLEDLFGLLTLKILEFASLRNGMSKFLIKPLSLSVCLSLSPFILWALLPWRILIQPFLT